MVEKEAKIKHLTDEQQNDLLKHIEGNGNDHNEFYIATRSGDPELLKNLINSNDNSPPDTRQSIDNLLAKAYEELKLKGVPLTENMELFVEEKLVNLRFFIERNNQNEKKVESSVENVKKRIETLCDQINKLKKGYLEETAKEVDGEFILIARFVAQNIHILKRQLKSTYDKLPWEEMEFCLVNFVSSHTKHQDIIVSYKLVLDKARLLNHLSKFEETLNKTAIKKDDVNSNYPKQAYKGLSVRNSAIKKVIENNPSFQDLYNDYEILKDVYSLKRIESYVELVLSFNLDQTPELTEILAIERTLQVIGESLKNTLDSPNVSDEIINMLVDSAPNNFRENITLLRDSYSRTLTKRVNFEDRKNLPSVVAIQEDLRKVEVYIGEILYKKKVDAIRLWLNKIIKSEDLLEVKKLANSVTGAKPAEIKLEYSITKELVKTTNMIDKLSNIINDKTELEQGLFNQIKEIFDSQRSRLIDVKYSYQSALPEINLIVNQINNNDNLKSIKNKCQNLLNAIKIPISTEKLQKSVSLVEEIINSVTPRKQRSELDEISKLCENITTSIISKSGMIQGIINFIESLEKKENDQGIIEEVNSIFRAIEMKIKYQQHKNKFLDKLNEAKQANNGPNRRNAYQTLLDSIKNSMKDEKFNNIPLHFKNFFRPIIKIKILENELNEIIDNIFKEKTELLDTRLKTLTDLVKSNNLEFLQKCRQDKKMQVAVEMVILDLTVILEKDGLFGDNQLFFDSYSPILMGKALRNYLAHGDPLIDTLPFKPSTAIIANALKLATEEKTSFRKKNILIGQIVREDLAYLANRYNQSLKLVINQNEMFIAAKQGNLEKVKDCIKAGADIRAKDIKGWTGVEFAVQGNNVEVLKYFLDQSLSVYNENLNSQKLLHIAATIGSENVINVLLEKGANINA